MTTCRACHERIAREDLKRVNGQAFHRQCAPDDVEVEYGGR